MALLKTYFDIYHVGLKEFNGMASSKPTQLRSERTKEIYQYFHNSVLPAMSVVEPKTYKQIVKSLSQVYRNKSIDVGEAISQIDPLLSGSKITTPATKAPSTKAPKKGGGMGGRKPPHIDTHTPSPSRDVPDAEVPPSPSHQIVEKKKNILKKCVKPKKERSEIVKKLMKSLNSTKEESGSESDTE